MTRLVLLNGSPGIGKSTLARRWATDRPGTLVCDVDVLRGLVPGVAFARAGALVRPAALAMITACLPHGDVVLPQLLADPAELDRFVAAGRAGGAEVVEVLLTTGREQAVARFHRRGADAPDDPWHAHVRRVVAAEGGDEALRRTHDRLVALVAGRPWTHVVDSVEGDVDGTLARLAAVL